MAYELSDIYVKVGMDMTEFQKGVKQVHSSFSKMQKNTAAVTSGFKKLTVATAGAGYAASKSIGYFAKYERSLSRIQLLGDATADTMNTVRDVVKKMGATTEFSASQAAKGIELLTMGGLELQKSMAALPEVINLATTSQTDMARAADIATNVMGQYSLAANELVRVNDALAKVQLTSNTNVLQAATAFEYAGTTAATMGLEIEELAGWIGIMAEKGIKGQRAGRMFRNVMLSMNDPTVEAKKVFEEYNVELEKSPGVLRPVGDIMQDIATKITNQGDRMRILNKETADVNKVFQAYADGTLPDYIRQIETADGVSANFAETLRKDVKGEIDTLIATIESVGIAIWERYSDEIEEAIEAVADTIRKHRLDIVDMTDGIANAIEGIANIDVDNSALAAMFDTMKKMMGLFSSLPPEIAGATGMGLVGTFLFGAKGGLLLGGGSYLLNELDDFFTGLDAVRLGEMSWADFFGDEDKFEAKVNKYNEKLKDAAVNFEGVVAEQFTEIGDLTHYIDVAENKFDVLFNNLQDAARMFGINSKAYNEAGQALEDFGVKLYSFKQQRLALRDEEFMDPQTLADLAYFNDLNEKSAERIKEVGAAYNNTSGEAGAWSKDLDELILKYVEETKTLGMSERELALHNAEMKLGTKVYEANIKEIKKFINAHFDKEAQLEKDNSVKKVIDELKREREALYQTDQELYVYNKLKEAGVEAGSEAAETIKEEANRVFELKENLEELREAAENFDYGDLPEAIGLGGAGEDDDEYFKKREDAYKNFLDDTLDWELEALEERYDLAIDHAKEQGEDTAAITEQYEKEKADLVAKHTEKTTSEMEKKWNHVTENIHDALADTFEDMFDEGLDSWEDFADSILDMMKSAFAEMAAYDLMISMGFDVGEGTGLSDFLGSSGISSMASENSLLGSVLGGVGDLMGGLKSSLSTLTSQISSFGAVEAGTGATAGLSLSAVATAGLTAALVLFSDEIGEIFNDLFGSEDPEPWIGLSDEIEGYHESVSDKMLEDWGLMIDWGDLQESDQEIVSALNEFFDEAFTAIDDALATDLQKVFSDLDLDSGDIYVDLLEYEDDLEGAALEVLDQLFGETLPDLISSYELDEGFFDLSFFEDIQDEEEDLYSTFAGLLDIMDAFGSQSEFLDALNRQIDEFNLGTEEAYENLEIMASAFSEIDSVLEALAATETMSSMRDTQDAWDSLVETLEEANATTEQVDEALQAMNETLGATISGITASSLESALTGDTDITELLSEGLRSTFASAIAESLYSDVFEAFNEGIGEVYEEGGLDAVAEALPDLIESLDLETITESQEELEVLEEILAELGLTASDAAKAVEGLSAASIQAAQAEIAGTSGEYELSQIAQRLDWQEIYGGIPSEEEIRSGIEWIVGASTDEIADLATSLGLSTSQLLDDVGSLSEAFDSIDEAAADAADATEDMAEALRNEIEALKDTIGAMEALEDLFENISGAGDLAAVQSMEYFERRYQELFEEAQTGGEREVENFTAFAEKYLKYAQGFGNYEERASDVLGDIEELEDNISDGRTLSDLYDQLDVTNAELDEIEKSTAATAQGMADALGEALEDLMETTTTPGWEQEGWSESGMTGLRDLYREAMEIGIEGGLGSGFEMGEGWLGEGSGVDIQQLSTGGYKATLYGEGGDELASGYFSSIEGITKSDVWEIATQSQAIMDLWESMFGPGGTKGYASGGYATGLSVVGEQGPEIVDFGSQGAEVYSNEESAGMIEGASGGPTQIVLQVDRKVLGKVIIEEAKYNKAFGKQIIKQIQAA